MNREDEASEIAQEIITIANTTVLGADARDEMIREVTRRAFKPSRGEPAVFRLIAAADVIALLGYTIGALMDDAKDEAEPQRPLRRLRIVEDNLRALDDE